MNRGIAIAFTALILVAAGCRGAAPVDPHEDANWSVTAWGEHYEIFAEVEPLIAGKAATSNTHVTVLSGFRPLASGRVTVLLRASDGAESAFVQEQPVRDGIFAVKIAPPAEGSYDMVFLSDSGGVLERIPVGTVRVGTLDNPGGLVGDAPHEHGPDPGHLHAAPTGARSGEAISFLKEQQWRTEFATDWVREGSLRSSVRGPARVRPVAGGMVVLTAPVDGVLRPEPWPFAGKTVRRGDAVVQIEPRVSPERSLADLESSATALRSELTVARDRSERLSRLLSLQAVSQAEAERARAVVDGLEARLAAAEKDLDAAKSYRQGGRGTGETLAVRAPFDGSIAEVRATPGEAVAPGTALASLVKTSPLWIDVALRPEDARRIGSQQGGLVVRSPGGEGPLIFDADRVRVIAGSPVVDASTGKVSVLFEVTGDLASLRSGSAVEAEVLLADEIRGVVVPASAIVDDGGVPIVYLQTEGEAFTRHEIQVSARQGDAALVLGLEPGERLVTRGGAAIRRASMLSSGPVEGHVH
jgi:RND family efflux transporter MFP subunit